MSVRVCWNLDCPEAGYLVEVRGDAKDHRCAKCDGLTEASNQLDFAESTAARRKALYADDVTGEAP
jgi:hypothetical protein